MAELMTRACDALATSLMQAIAARIVGNNSSALAELANCREPVDGPHPLACSDRIRIGASAV